MDGITWVLMLVFFWPSGDVANQKIILQTDTEQQCNNAKSRLLTVQGYDAKHLLCLPGYPPMSFGLEK